MPIDLNAIRANPKFSALSYEEQSAVTRRVLQQKLQQEAAAQQLSSQELDFVVEKAAETYTPVLREGKNAVLTDSDRIRFSQSLAPTVEANDETKYVLWLAEQARKGDEQAMKRAEAWMITRRIANETLVGKALLGGKDIYEQIRYADRDWDLGFDPDTTKKLSGYLAQSMGQRGQGALGTANVAAGVASFAENVALNAVFVGSMAAPGLLTKGAFAAGKLAAAGAAPGIARSAAKTIASYGIEALGSASIDVLRALPELIQTGQLQGSKKFWTETAATFGEGVAYDVLFNFASDVVRAGFIPLGKVFFGKGLDLNNSESVKNLQSAITQATDQPRIIELIRSELDGRTPSEIFSQLDPDVQVRIKDSSARLRSLEGQKPGHLDSDEFLAVYGKASGYDVTPLKKGYLIERDGSAVTSAASRADAFSWLQANPKVEFDTDDLMAPYRGQMGAKAIVELHGNIDPAKLSDDTLLGMSLAVKDGATSPKTIRLAIQTMLKRSDDALSDDVLSGIKSASTSEAVFRKKAANIQQLIADHPDSIVVPKTLNDPSSRELFLDYLTAFGRSKNPGFRNLAVEYAERSAVSPQGLTAAAKSLPEGELLKQGEEWRLSYRDTQGQLVTRVTQTPEQTAQSVGRALTETGMLSEDEIVKSVYKDTGVAIVPETSEFGTLGYVARTGDGEIIARGPTLTSVFEQRPALWPRLPERLGPEMYYLGGGNRFEIRKNIAVGPYSEILRTMNSFGASQVPASWKVVEVLDGKKVRIKAPAGSRITTHFGVEVPGLGYQTNFTTLKKAREFVEQGLDSWESVRRIANERGYDLQAGPKGSTLISTLDGQGHAVAKNLDEVKQVLQRSPVSESHKNLFTAVDDQIDNAITHQVQVKLETDTTAVEKSALDAVTRLEKKLKPAAIRDMIDSRIAPAYSAMEREGKRAGRPDIPVKARELSASTRAMGAANLQATRVIRAITSPGGKLIKRDVSEVLGRVLAEGSENWDSAAKSLGLELTPQYRAVLNGTKAYYDRLSEVFGVDTWRYLTDYAPKIRAKVADFRAQGALAGTTKNQLLTATFGSKWRSVPEISFFAQHGRMDNFLDATRNRMSIVDQMVSYTEDGYRELYLGSIQQKLAGWYKELSKADLSAASANRIKNFYETVLGGGVQDGLATELQETSLALTSKFAEGVNKLGGVFPKPLADAFAKLAQRIETPDIAGKASAMVTHATLSFRPFRAISNMFQYLNTFSVFGDDAIRAATSVTDEEVEQLFRKGVIQEKVFASSAQGIEEANAFLEMGLKAQKQTEYLTRAWTAKAAGTSFDEALGRLATGKLNWQQFVQESKLNLLDQTGIDSVLKHIQAGNPEAGRTLFQTEAVRTLMFDYAKENYPMMFKGVIGRAFGKFGIYPVGQVDLYRRIMTSGSLADKAIRATRMIAGSVLVYNTFRQVGVDYSGFLWNDAFSFSGGPMFQTGLNVLNVADQGPQGAMARRDLARSFLPGIDSDGNFTLPRLVVPGALEVNALIKAASMAQDDPYRAALTALGATTTKDWLRGGLQVW
jgi:hypothetical protein